MSTADLEGQWQLFISSVLALLGGQRQCQRFFSSTAVNIGFPLDYSCLPRKTPMYTTRQVGLCTSSSSFALLLIQLMSISWTNYRSLWCWWALLLFNQGEDNHLDRKMLWSSIFCDAMPGCAVEPHFAGKLFWSSAQESVFWKVWGKGVSCGPGAILPLFITPLDQT